MGRRIFLGLALFFWACQAAAGCAAPGALSRLGYSIQVGSFAEVRRAEALAGNLQSRGLEAFYFRNDKGYYAVRFGDFPTREEAAEKARRLLAEKIIGEYFIAPPAAGIGKPAAAPAGAAESAGVEKGMGRIAARTAERFVGIPYRWGGDTVVEGLDCSGFVRAVYNLCGVVIPRTAAQQFTVGRTVEKPELAEGDLVFFGSAGRITHVGIYVGNGRFVHAPKRGQEIMVSSLSEPGYARSYRGAKRYF